MTRRRKELVRERPQTNSFFDPESKPVQDGVKGVMLPLANRRKRIIILQASEVFIVMMRLIGALSALLGCQIALYFGCECFQKKFHDVYRPVDAKIPFVEWTVLVYVLWFPLIVLLPLALYAAEPMAFARYYPAMALEVILSVVCYLVYPTTFTRPVPSDTWAGKLMKMVYSGSFRGVNCAPSLHCSSCYLSILCAVTCAGMPFALRLLTILIAAGIVISTMTTKQHTLLDALTAIPVALICWLLGLMFPATGLIAWIVG